MKRTYISLCFFLLLFFSSCNTSKNSHNVQNFNSEYARYFDIEGSDSATLLHIKESWIENSTKTYNYNLIGSLVNESNPNSSYSIQIPLKKVVCMSTSHVAYLTALGLDSCIIAISGAKYISNPSIKKRLQSGSIVDIGYEGSINYERLIALKPDVVFTYGISGENVMYIEKLKQYGIKVLVLGDYLENHPLGKLEYLKLFGRLFNRVDLADSIYSATKERYLELKTKADSISFRPTVLMNAPWKEMWYIPGNDNYISVLIRDAGAQILCSKQNESRSSAFSTEEIYQSAANADYWLNPNSFESLQSLSNDNPLFKSIAPLKNKKVYNNVKRKTDGGGSDFWEKGVVEPDKILEDLIRIFHPEIIKKGEFHYYIQLN